MSTKAEWLDHFELAALNEETVLQSLQTLRAVRRYQTPGNEFFEVLAAAEVERWFGIHRN